MRSILLLIILVLSFQANANANANEFTYEKISTNNPGVALSVKEVDAFKMHGKCLVGLKELNFKKKDKFDPVAEWTSYRTLSLLEQFPPCEVLVMMEVARKELLKKQEQR
ncbi:hypothetical protein [Zhongshania arctica]|uniref:Uncharacterized protein n=1 Tax=Zhongshania arctica TaxID=3238302 RepID=A0ABV3TU42_9GAMM